MRTQLLEMNLSEPLVPLAVKEGYNGYRILVRTNFQLVGWVYIPGVKESSLSIAQLQQAIKEQLMWDTMQQSLAINSGLANNKEVPEVPISIIVCTRNRTEQLATCLTALLQLSYTNYEIIVIDNAPSTTDTFELAANLPVRYVREDRPGLDWARNRGIEEAKHTIVAYTDDDTIADTYWLQNIARAFNNDSVMCVTGYVAPAELETEAQQLFERSYGGMSHGFHRKLYNKQTVSERQIIWASGMGVGANMAFRKSVFDTVGKFDIALDVGTPSRGGGDIEMFHRVVASGFTLLYDPSVLIWHHHRRSMHDLQKQIEDNGKGFGCYLITAYKNNLVSRSGIIRFFIIDWWWKWNLHNFIKPPKKWPRSFTWTELAGMCKSPAAYKASQQQASKIVAKKGEPNLTELSL